MGATAGIYPISELSYQAGVRGDAESRSVSEIVAGVDIDKAWHAIHYLLTKNTSMFFLLTGQQIPGVSEHCEVHSPASVAQLWAEVAGLTVQDLMINFDPERFSAFNCYPGIWNDQQGHTDQGRGYLEQQLQRFLAALKEAAGNKLGLLVTIH